MLPAQESRPGSGRSVIELEREVQALWHELLPLEPRLARARLLRRQIEGLEREIDDRVGYYLAIARAERVLSVVT